MKRPIMPRLIFSLLALALTPLVSVCQVLPSETETGWVTGRVVSADGLPIVATIEIGDQTFETDQRGRFAISPRERQVYRIEFKANGHYAMRHTFSHAELQQDPIIHDVVLIAKKPERTLFVFGGDVMIGRRFYDPFEGEPVLVSANSILEDSKALLAEMKPYLERADYASINLETPIFETPPSEPAPKSVTFYSAPETLDALEWAGVDYVALGNNHIYDFLEPGLDITMQHLGESALNYSGAGKTEAEALSAFRLSRGAHAYDFLSYVGWPAGPPTQTAAPGKGGAAFGTLHSVTATTRASVDRSGTPVLQFHGGLEYVEEPTLAIETRLKNAVDEGAGLVIGHHPHVVQGLELYQGKLIAWSLGNFLFDQYFYSAQSAALLYVWMDGDEFYHAEAVPLYIKGYHPTPALGPMRNAINRRLFELSAKRSTQLKRSGGHMVLARVAAHDGPPPTFDVAMDCAMRKMRSGHDLIARGDFDAHDLFGAPDRSWLDLDERVRIEASDDDPSNFAMQIDLSARDTITTGMRKFQRVFTPGTPMSIRADIRSTAKVKVDAYIQIRAIGQGLDDALSHGQKILVGSTTLNAGAPTQLDFDFDSPRTRARSIRLLLELSAEGGDSDIQIDNLELIEWKTPFVPEGMECRDG